MSAKAGIPSARSSWPLSQRLFDPTRAPEGKHVLWAYCHVPNGSAVDMTERIEAQIERFAPGFRDCILARHVSSPAALEAMDANLIGGDISGGSMEHAAAHPSPGSAQLLHRAQADFIFARHRRRPVAECMACAGIMPPARRCAGRRFRTDIITIVGQF